MKFIKLEILNLASLDRQGGEVINFEEGALGNSTIFSIVGPTGAGKSTILDAICLALYNRTPRYPRKKGDRNQHIEVFGKSDEDENNTLAPTDSRNILTRGRKEGYSKLTFLANNGTIYRAEWYVRKKTKRFDDPITSLYKLSISNGVITEEVEKWENLSQIIGLDYEQFLRTVLIAQGAFANFLTAKENERYELLEKLTGCEELYTNIYTLIKDEDEKAKKTYNDIVAKISVQDKDIIKDPTELQNLIELINRLEEENTKEKKELSDVTTGINWYDTNDRYNSNIEKYKETLNLAKRDIDSISTDAERLSLHDATIPAVGYYKEIVTATGKINSHEATLKQFDEQKKAKEQEKSKEEEELAKRSVKVEKANKEYNEQKPCIDRARVIKGELSTSQAALKDKQEAKQKAEEASKAAKRAVEENTKAIANAEDAKKKAEADLEKLRNEVEEKKQELQSLANTATEVFDKENNKKDSLDATTLQDNVRNAERKQNDIKEAIGILKDIDAINDSIEENNKQKDTLADRNNQIAQELPGLNIAISELTKEIEALNNTYILMTSEDWKMHRTHLSEGAPCPLCGSKNHPYKDIQDVNSVTNNLKIIIDKKQSDLNAQTSKKEELSNEMNKNQGILDSLVKTISDLLNKQKEQKDKWSRIHSTYPDWKEDADSLIAFQEKISDEVTKANNEQREYNNLIKHIEELRKSKEKAEKDLDKFKKESDAKLKSCEDTLNVANTTLSTEKGKSSNLTQQKEEKDAAYNLAISQYDETEKNVQDKKNALKKEIGDNNDPDTLERQLINNKTEAEGSVQEKKKEIASINESIKELEGKIASLRKTRDDEKNKLDQNSELLNEWIESYNNRTDQQAVITIREIEQLYSATDDWEKIRSRQKAFNDTYTSAVTTLHNEEKALDEHQKNMPQIDKDTLVSRKAELESKSYAELIDAKAKKKRHDDAEAQTGTLGKERDAAELYFKEWEEIKDAIGSDGKTLRKIAQCYTLRFLIEHANVEIRKFNSRYELVQVKNSLGIRVIDHDRADDIRDTTSLSGGETFIVSLGLALGLSSLSSRSISFENLFIDEGFGTLDPDTLDTVIDSLASLQSSQGKKVGVISHTDTMSERITTQIRIIKNGNSGSSHIEIYP